SYCNCLCRRGVCRCICTI
nr:Chain A, SYCNCLCRRGVCRCICTI [Macaca mulatta]